MLELYIIPYGEWRPMAEARHAVIIMTMPEETEPALVKLRQMRIPDTDTRHRHVQLD